MRYLAIKNFKKHQHYKDRRPPWIKLHVAILDDYAFTCLQDASKAHLLLLGVLASKMDNRIPYDLAFLTRKLGTTEPIDLEELITQGFIIVTQDDSTALAAGKRSAMVETEGEAETEAENRGRRKALVPRKAAREAESYPPAFEATFSAYPKRGGGNSKRAAFRAWRARKTSGVDPAEIHAGVERYAAYIRAEGKENTTFVMQAATFFGPDEHWREAYDPPAAPPRPANAAGVAPEVLAQAVTLWPRYRTLGLLTRLPRAEYERIGREEVERGGYASVDAFLEELRTTRPWEGLNDFRNEGAAINELAKRIARKVA